MKRLITILVLTIIAFTLKAQTPVKLTDGQPAWIPNYLILDGSLYFRHGTSYTSLGDTLYYFISKSDSAKLYYTPRQIDSVLATKTFSPWIIYGTDSIEYNNKVKADTLISKRIGIGTTTPQKDLDIIGDASISDTLYLGNVWRYYIKSDTLMFEFNDGSGWLLMTKTYK